MFRVEWLQSALNDLADAWMQGDAAQREAINVAVRGIDFRNDGLERVSCLYSDKSGYNA
jgi:hypothetical protein